MSTDSMQDKVLAAINAMEVPLETMRRSMMKKYKEESRQEHDDEHRLELESFMLLSMAIEELGQVTTVGNLHTFLRQRTKWRRALKEGASALQDDVFVLLCEQKLSEADESFLRQENKAVDEDRQDCFLRFTSKAFTL
jgi:hypothetical protein